MRSTVLVLALAGSLFACDSKKSSGQGTTQRAEAAKKPAAPLTDLTTASTLEPMRVAFNAKKGQARFLTLLSPT